jgi:Tol biopolymer transport system component
MISMNRLEHCLCKVNFIVLGLFSVLLFSCEDDPEAPLPGRYPNGDIAFASDRNGSLRIFIMSNNGENQRQVTDDAVIHAQGEEYYSPAISEQFGKIAFIVYPKGSPASVQLGIGIVNIDGSGKKLLGSGVPDLQYISQISAPSWDFVGNVFFAAGDPNSLYYYKKDNGGILKVDANWCYPANGFGCWQSASPNAHMMSKSYTVLIGVDSKIVQVNYLTGVVQTLTEFGKNRTPNYNYTGHDIVTSNGTDIFTISISDQNGTPYIITNQITKNSGVNLEPVWSPDGMKIAFTSYRDGNAEIYVMDNNGANQKNITNNPGNDTGPSWAPGKGD